MKRPALPPWARTRTQHDTLPSFALALAVHALLFGGISFVVRWNTQDPAPVVAELWAAPVTLPPQRVVEAPPPPPPPPPPPKVEPQPAPPPKPEADIVLKEEKKPPPKKEEPKKVEEKKPKKDELAELLKKQEQAEREAKERAEREAKARAEREAKARAEREAKTRAEREALRQAEADRILQQMQQDRALVGTPQPGTGSSRDNEYRSRLIALIKSRIIYAVPDGTSPEVHADVQVDLLPTGEIAAVRILRPSGLQEYDAAVERAIRRTDPFPRKPDGTVDRTITIRFRPVEVER